MMEEAKKGLSKINPNTKIIAVTQLTLLLNNSCEEQNIHTTIEAVRIMPRLASIKLV